jgi:FixJ family two-component response regulator
MTRSGAGGQVAGDPPLVAVVDDDESVRTSTCRLIRSFGYRAEAFGSGPEFLSSPAATQTACLVLDVRMPGVDGLEVQRRVTAEGLDIPIVFISGRASDDEERRARSAGAVDFLRKPVDTARLRQLLDEIVSQRRP